MAGVGEEDIPNAITQIAQQPVAASEKKLPSHSHTLREIYIARPGSRQCL
jgi:hypothetical protein